MRTYSQRTDHRHGDGRRPKCAKTRALPCEHHYTTENSGLEHSWEGETVFCNPPYGRNIGDWIRKASQEASKPDTLVVLLVPARTDTRWFQNHILHRAEVRFLPGRLKYEVNGQAGEAAPFPSMIVVMRTGER